MSVPGWYTLLLLGLAAWRTWHLLGWDDIATPIRRRLGVYAGEFLACPYCAGFWTALAWWAAWEAWPFTSEVIASAVAVTALVPLIERLSSDD